MLVQFVNTNERRKLYREVYREDFENLEEGKHFAFYIGDLLLEGTNSKDMLFAYKEETGHFHLVSDNDFTYHAEAVLEDEAAFTLLEVIE